MEFSYSNKNYRGIKEIKNNQRIKEIGIKGDKIKKIIKYERIMVNRRIDLRS